ncbi:MAG: hypothetical protein MUO59_03175 [Actinobacteria bacterium]|nr:hypothetical protein [Actinomycetota bacterium]
MIWQNLCCSISNYKAFKGYNMYYARVIGNIVSTMKYKGLKGKKIQIIQPVNIETGKDSGSFLVALDADFFGYR